MKYPIYIPSKGRSDVAYTADFLIRDGIPFHLVVEPQEYDLYKTVYGEDKLYILPFSNLGLGSIPARNWIKEHATALGYERHWILDDNIRGLYRRYKGYRIPCHTNIAFSAVEDFVDRYENIGIIGLNYTMFVPDYDKVKPFCLNVHVYSAMCILNSLPYKWRGRYNEDTDLCLQVLADGWCTVLVNAFLADKQATMTMKGGNSTSLYKADGRLKMARSLERLWPGVVETKRRFRRPQHVIKDTWRGFNTPLKLKENINLNSLDSSKYDMQLVQVAPEIKGKHMKKLLDEYKK
jgi:hypothetical protein